MSFKIEDDEVYINYHQIWNKIKELLDVKFRNPLFSGDKIPKERVEYVCIACISIDSISRVNKKIIHNFI